MLLAAGRTPFVRDMGGFAVRPNFPGWLKPWPTDHGYGPLAMVVESILAPGRLIAMHEHRDDEIISWVPEGVMRYDDRWTGPRIVDRDHLLVVNAGRSFWHSDETLPTDPALRMLQIIIRPRAIGLEPNVQHGPIVDVPPNAWRHLLGPEGTDAPFFVRNSVDFYDIRLEPGAEVAFPTVPGRDVYFYVFSGAIRIGRRTFTEAHQGLLIGDKSASLKASEPTVMVAFLIDPNAPSTRGGTVGDSKDIPPPIVGKLGLAVLGARNWLRNVWMVGRGTSART